MGVNDAREQLEVAKAEVVRLEREHAKDIELWAETDAGHIEARKQLESEVAALAAENARLRNVIARARREARSWPSRRVDHFAEGLDAILAESCVEAAPR